MKRLSLLLPMLLIASSVARADLDSDVRKILRDPFISRVTHSIELVKLDSAAPRLLFESDSTSPLVPASNLKLVTTSAAFQQLGPNFRFRTLLVEHGGDLVLIGDGDPSFGDAELLKKSGWDVQTVFATWANGLAKRHLASVRRLLVDDSVFDDQFLHPHWPADQSQKHYMAEVAGLNLNANVLDVFVHPSGTGRLVSYVTDPTTHYFSVKNTCVSGSGNSIWLSREPDTNDLILRGQAAEANDVPVTVTIHDPPLYAGTVLAEQLEAAGIPVGSVGRDRSAREHVQRGEPGWTLLAVHQTPLTTVISRANKDSMNLYAECCCKRLGFAATGEGSWATGTAAVGTFLSQIGVLASQYHLDDGCGLSKDNRISAHLMTKVLEHDFYSASARTYMSTMAVAGVDGTLEERFRGTDLRGRVLAKTGFVNGVSCLSGYLHARNDQWYAFSIMFNNVPAGGTSQAKTIEEKIVRAVDVNSRAG